VLCLALSFTKPSNSQVDSTTGNLVNITSSPTAITGKWVNGVYVNELTCWQGGDPGNCGPNPSIRPGGNINFSYGQVNLNQVVNIKNALAEAGTGILLSGFNFGFTAKNGNGWDNGQQDYLSAYVKIYDNAAKVVENYDYTQYTNRKYNWSNFNFTETFKNPYDITKLGAAQFGFIGKDTNFWSGTYGPEIMNVNFSLNYRVDPCVANPASSPSCPGFGNLIKTSVLSIPSTSIYSLVSDTSTNGATIINAGGVQLSTTGTISAPDNIPQTIKDTQASIQQSQAAATISQPQQVNKTASLSSIMSIISQVQTNDKATQTMAVQNANKVVSASISQSQEQAMTTVATLNAMSVTSIQTTQDIAPVQIPTIFSQPTSSAIQLQSPTTISLQNLMAIAKTNNEQPAPQALSIVQQQNTVSSVSEIQPQQIYQQQTAITLVTESIQAPAYQLLPTNTTAPIAQTQISVYQEFVNATSEFALTTPTTKVYLGQMPEAQQSTTIPLPTVTTTTESISFATKSENKYNESDVPAITIGSITRGNSIMELAETRANIETSQNEQITDTVKKNVQSNELAGSVDIAAMSIQPKGFDVYSTLIIKDSAFYAPKEIYGNQKTIDNARIFRLLGSDRLHQEMVEQQYRR